MKTGHQYILPSEAMNDLKVIRDSVQREYFMGLFGSFSPVRNSRKAYYEKINRVIEEAKTMTIKEERTLGESP